ncbi:hypothetical protein GW916_06875 [bacterium]|nr:hypothetical protein [bacterium]
MKWIWLFVALATLGSIGQAATTKVIADGFPQVMNSQREGVHWQDNLSVVILNEDNLPVERASLVVDGKELLSDNQGRISVPTAPKSDWLVVKKPGFQKVYVAPQESNLITVKISLQEINAVYVSTGFARNLNGSKMSTVLELMEETQLNAIVIDVKDDEGRVSSGLEGLVSELKSRGVYTIARVVTFKDNRAPRKNSNLGIQRSNGKLWADRNNVTYLNPMNSKAHDYVISVANSAVDMGFDEIQFDYVRFPTDGALGQISWGVELNSDVRSQAIASFLKKARAALGKRGAYVSADVFGITGHDKNDSGIGQHLETIVPHIDYASPMVYPSGYASGTFGIKSPAKNPYDIVKKSLDLYTSRALVANPDLIIRPWLQAFRDYSKDKQRYGDKEIKDQIKAAMDSGSLGFLLWNASSNYTYAGLKRHRMRKP